MTKKSKRSKKRDNGNDPFSIIPLDLKIDILLRLPVKTIARLSFLSKHWSSIIRNKDFTKVYMTRSLTRPRLLFVYNKEGSLFLESSSHEDLSSSDQKVSITFHPDDYMNVYNIFTSIRGLICHQNDSKVMIGNPSTGQFITLPRVRTRGRDLFSFLGYDPVNDLYKVLCITVRKCRSLSDRHQVFTLGRKQKWRKITCKHPHLPAPYTEGICIDGVVCYCAWIRRQVFLICFDVTSEDFNVIKLPEDIECPCLVNYGGKIALSRLRYKTSVTTLNLWVLQDAKKEEWSKVSHSIPSWTDLVEHHKTMSFKGILSTGHLIFAPLSHRYSAYFLISYDPKENTTKKVVIEGIGERPVQLFIHHAESPINVS